jgi:D-galactarolactone cycloisomerase
MKIESVEGFPISIKVEETLKGGTFAYTHYQTVLVRVVADGEEGWGEAMTRFDNEATALMVKYFGRAMTGQKFKGVGEVWAKSWHELRVRGHTRGIGVEAISGIEIALHDSLGHLLRRPLNTLLSRSTVPRVPVFAGSLFASRGPLERQVEEAKSRGLAGAKVKIGLGAREDALTLGRVRSAWPEGMIVADANGAYDAPGALKACRAFSDLNLAWFEEPVLSDDFEGYRALKRSRVKIGAGESWFAGDFGTPIEERLVGVIEPSVSRCGGVGVLVDVATRAAARDIEFSPMTGMNSAVSLAASVHVASARPSVGVEYNPFPNPLQTELATGLGSPKGGSLDVPRGYGLGITVDFRFVKDHLG